MQDPGDGVTAIKDNHVIGYAMVAPDQLLAHPHNFRRHPGAQRDALRGSLRELGWIAPVLVNKTTGHMLDGHARVEEALSAGVLEVPVAYVEVPEDKESLAMLSLDPIAAMAETDKEQLDELLRDVSTGESGLQAMLAELAESAGLIPPDVEFREYDESVADDVEYLECPECGHRWPK